LSERDYTSALAQMARKKFGDILARMKIAMLSYHTCPLATLGGKDTGGMNVYVRELTRQLGQMGVHVDVFTRSQDEHVPHISHDLGYGNRVVHIPAGPEVPLPKQELAAYLPQFVRGIQEFAQMKGLQYDLIHSHYWMSGVAALDLKAAWHVPVINMFHTLVMMKNRVARKPSEIEGAYRLEGEQKVLKEADRIVAATPAELAQLQWLYGADTRRVVVVPPGVDLCHFYPIDNDEAKDFIGVTCSDHMLLFVGRIEPLKGLDVLLKAFAIMRQQGVFERFPVCLAVIGGDPDANPDLMSTEMVRIKRLCRRYGLQDLVTFLGKRSQDTLPYYYSAAEALVMPSHYESFGMVALEAMACGTPVVASQVGGLAFLVQDGVTGYTVPSGEPGALAERLTALISQPALRCQMGEQAVQVARGYGWEKIATRIVAAYEETLEMAKVGEISRHLI
jgi:D-inositol-3-phosphate glycosyltransferase